MHPFEEVKAVCPAACIGRFLQPTRIICAPVRDRVTVDFAVKRLTDVFAPPDSLFGRLGDYPKPRAALVIFDYTTLPKSERFWLVIADADKIFRHGTTLLSSPN